MESETYDGNMYIILDRSSRIKGGIKESFYKHPLKCGCFLGINRNSRSSNTPFARDYFGIFSTVNGTMTAFGSKTISIAKDIRYKTSWSLGSLRSLLFVLSTSITPDRTKVRPCLWQTPCRRKGEVKSGTLRLPYSCLAVKQIIDYTCGVEAPPAGIKPATCPPLEDSSVHLSYGGSFTPQTIKEHWVGERVLGPLKLRVLSLPFFTPHPSQSGLVWYLHRPSLGENPFLLFFLNNILNSLQNNLFCGFHARIGQFILSSLGFPIHNHQMILVKRSIGKSQTFILAEP